VTIQGTLSAIDGSVAASHIVLKGNHPTFVEGTLSFGRFQGPAPPEVFRRRRPYVTTIPPRLTRGGTCLDLVAGARVQIKGLLRPTTVLSRHRIKFKHDDVNSQRTKERVRGPSLSRPHLPPGSDCSLRTRTCTGPPIPSPASRGFRILRPRLRKDLWIVDRDP